MGRQVAAATGGIILPGGVCQPLCSSGGATVKTGLKIGIIGGGVVGRATAGAFVGWRDTDVRVWDVVPERRTVGHVDDVLDADVVFVCLPTPGGPDGRLDTSTLDQQLSYFGCSDHWHRNYVIKSTVPIGYTRQAAKRWGLSNIVHSPEFLTERTAGIDAMMPSRLIVGLTGFSSQNNWLRDIYAARFPGTRVLVMRSDESEAVKLFTNGFYATKVAYFNEVRALADRLGMDWETVRAGVLSGGTVHPLHTLVPGPDGKRGFGGSCLPKDAAQLVKQIEDNKLRALVTLGALNRNYKFDRKKGGAK